MPAFRHTVEELFTAGLVKAVFATETLALGINMPARTVVLERLVKYNGEQHAPLTPGEYTQLTGRAGRRVRTLGAEALALEHVFVAAAVGAARVVGGTDASTVRHPCPADWRADLVRVDYELHGAHPIPPKESSP